MPQQTQVTSDLENGVLFFSREELKPLIEHSQKPGQVFYVAYSDEETDPCLFLVKDRGVYLMAATKEALPGDDTVNHVVYAKGLTPDSIGH